MTFSLLSPPQSVKHSFLLVTLLLLSVLYPLIGGRLVLDAILGVVLFSGIFAVVEARRVFRIALLLAVVAIVSRGVDYVDSGEILAVVSDGAIIAIWLITAGAILKDVLRDDVVTWDKICGALCVYLLIGVTWGQLYSLVARADPGAFRGVRATSTEDAEAVSSQPGEAANLAAAERSRAQQVDGLNYFSFVTLTTLGYGDIVPISPLARTLAWLEAVTGQIYLTVLVARLVALHIAHTRAPRRD